MVLADQGEHNIQIIYNSRIVLMVSILFFGLYSETFQGNNIAVWTHGPYEFDCGCYVQVAKSYALACDQAANTKVQQHLIIGLTYPYLYKLFSNSKAISAFYVALGLLAFGLWTSITTKDPVLAGIMTAMLGSSYAVWYVGSVVEARSAIFFGATLLWIAAYLIHTRPSALMSVLASILSMPLVLASIGNIYAVSAVMLAVFLSRPQYPSRRLLYMGIYLFSTIAMIFSSYYFSGKMDENLNIDWMLPRVQKNIDSRSYALLEYLNYNNASLVARQFILSTVIGHTVPVKSTSDVVVHWIKGRGIIKSIWKGIIGKLTLLMYAGILLMAFYGAMMTPNPGMYAVALWWIIAEILFFTYYYPWDGAPYGVQITVPIWGAVALAIGNVKRGKYMLIIAFLVCLLIHNLNSMALIAAVK